MTDFLHPIETYLDTTSRLIASLPSAQIVAAVDLLFDAWQRRSRVYVCGNGGSGAIASHFAGDLNKAYGYMAPSYRAVTSLERYSSSIGGVATWVGAEVIRVECATEKCTARLKIEAKPAATMHFKANITTGVDETWLLEDGQWWLFQKL